MIIKLYLAICPRCNEERPAYKEVALYGYTCVECHHFYQPSEWRGQKYADDFQPNWKIQFYE